MPRPRKYSLPSRIHKSNNWKAFRLKRLKSRPCRSFLSRKGDLYLITNLSVMKMITSPSSLEFTLFVYLFDGFVGLFRASATQCDTLQKPIFGLSFNVLHIVCVKTFPFCSLRPPVTTISLLCSCRPHWLPPVSPVSSYCFCWHLNWDFQFPCHFTNVLDW